MTSTANGKMKFPFCQNIEKVDVIKLFSCLLTRYRGVSFNLKVLAKFGLCSNCSQKLPECSLARAHKIFATARMLTFSFKCARLLEISLVLLCSYFLYINDISIMTRLRRKG